MTAKSLTNGEAWRRTIIGSATSAAVALGSVFGYLEFQPQRTDPFTGSEADALRREIKADREKSERRLETRLEASEAALSDIWGRMSDLPPRRWRRRIEALEIEAIKKNPNYQIPQ